MLNKRTAKEHFLDTGKNTVVTMGKMILSNKSEKKYEKLKIELVKKYGEYSVNSPNFSKFAYEIDMFYKTLKPEDMKGIEVNLIDLYTKKVIDSTIVSIEDAPKMFSFENSYMLTDVKAYE